MTPAAPSIFAAHLAATERSLALAMEAVTAARAAFDAGQLDDAAGLASLMRDATKAIWEAHSDAYEAFTVSEQVRCDREDAKYLAFVARAA